MGHAEGQASAADVSPTRLSALLERAFDASPDGMLIHEDGRVVRSNAAAGRIFRETETGLDGQMLADLIHGEKAEDVVAWTSGAATRPQEMAVGAGSRRTPVLVWSLPVEAAGGAGVLVVRDLTADREQARKQRERVERDAELVRLEQVNRFKTRLLNTAAHELNTPLTPLRLQTHLLKSGSLGKLQDRQQKAVEVLQRNVDRLSMLVEDILDVARLESGHLKIEKQAMSLADLVQEAAQAYEETARGMGVGLRVDMDQSVVALADPRRISQVLYNLVSNALKFTPEGGTVSIRVHAGDRAWVEVRDTGIGMTRDQIARLFEPFSRVHDTDKVTVAGTGLGLYISRGIVEGHSGTLAVESDGPGKGTAFRFDLPLAGTEPTEEGSQPQGRPSPMVAGPLAQRLRELI